MPLSLSPLNVLLTCRSSLRSQRLFSTLTTEQLAFSTLLQCFREYGHIEADIDPLQPRNFPDDSKYLPKQRFDSIWKKLIQLDSSQGANYRDRVWNGEQLYGHLKDAYCGKIGYEIQHLSSSEEKTWLANAIECSEVYSSTPSELLNSLTLMIMADTFENFLKKKYPSYKRYSGEGSESMFPFLNKILHLAAVKENDVSNVVIGMPHRGRLALLVSLLEYPAHKIFSKVDGNTEFPPIYKGVDDVTSHIATSMDKLYGNDKVHVSLLPNPSHLECINAVVNGKTRAKIDNGEKAISLLLHGDAAFAGQGCVPEGLSLSQLPGFTIGGSIHLIVNNQVGFTTTYPDSRSTRYCSDVAKSIDAPILHVNGGSIPHVLRAASLAMAYRTQFGKDIVVDLITYRRYGHNEVDEPRFTQPKMYAIIDKTVPLAHHFGQELEDAGVISSDRVQKLQNRMSSHLQEEFEKAKSYAPMHVDAFKQKWNICKQPKIADLYDSVETGTNLENLIDAGIASIDVPQHISIHDRLERSHILSRKRLLAMEANNIKLDWGTAEAMAFGTLIAEGYSVRLSGQDCRRGTFSHRHAAFTDQNSGSLYFPFDHWQKAEGKFRIINSNLSEFAVMGFEYGYSLEDPRTLVLWEAQFGDFNNAAQIIIDQFLASGETKWMKQSGLVLLLPHGYDGAGPDHSSGKLERFLQLVDSPALDSVSSKQLIDWKEYTHNSNLIVVNATTPANYYHLLHRQQKRAFRKPVVLLAPKTLLRLPEATSSIHDMGPGTSFQPIYADESVKTPAKVRHVMLCSGKIYYDLVRERQSRLTSRAREKVAIVRIEELAPFPFPQLVEYLGALHSMEEVTWVQEEPLNQGAWMYIRPHLEKIVQKQVPINYIGRQSLAASAVGTSKRHAEQAEEIFRQAFGAKKVQR